MFKSELYVGSLLDKYYQVTSTLNSLISGEKNRIANLANATALLNYFFDNINWVGFYLLDKEELVLGPFQGLPACNRISLTQGICGYAANLKKTVRIDDVTKFPGHIACDPNTKSEIVIPLLQDQHLIAVLDIDSPKKNRFTFEDEQGLAIFTKELIKHL